MTSECSQSLSDFWRSRKLWCRGAFSFNCTNVRVYLMPCSNVHLMQLLKPSNEKTSRRFCCHAMIVLHCLPKGSIPFTDVYQQTSRHGSQEMKASNKEQVRNKEMPGKMIMYRLNLMKLTCHLVLSTLSMSKLPAHMYVASTTVGRPQYFIIFPSFSTALQ